MDRPASALYEAGTTSGLSELPRWYAVSTYPRHEKAVTERLDCQSLETFFPTFESESRWKDRRVTLHQPVFPGYVFTRITLGKRNAVLNIPGVSRLLSFNGRPAPIDDAEIDAVRRCRERGAAFEPHPFLEVGERVRVQSGVLEGLEGVVTRRKNGCRLVISIAQLYQSVAVEIDANSLTPA